MNDPNRKIRWGVLGYAPIAYNQVIPAIQRSSNSEFYALGSRDRTKLAECKARFKCPETHLGYDELLRDPLVDAVYIALPHALHCEWTIKAAEHGKHVLCEKPIALHSRDCVRMMDACRTQGVTLMEAFMYRYTHRTRRVREVLQSGVLGEIRTIQSEFRFLMDNTASTRLVPELGGGAFYDIGCYPLNFTGMVVDELGRQPGAGGALSLATRPVSVSAEADWVNGVDMSLSAILRYPSGLMATLSCGFDSYRRIASVITGTLGVLEIPDSFGDDAGSLTFVAGDKRSEIPVEKSDRYRSEIEDFADAVSAKRPPHVPIAETLRNMEVMDQIYSVSKK